MTSLWRRLTWLERANWIVVVALLAPCFGAVNLVLRRVNPELAVAVAAWDGPDGGDPWGQPWRWRAPPGEKQSRQGGLLSFAGSRDVPPGALTCSAGPNGIDENGSGDDLFVSVALHDAWYAKPLAYAPTAAILFVLLLTAWGLVLGKLMPAPRASLAREVGRAVVIASIPTLPALWAAHFYRAELEKVDAPTLLVPLPLAAAGTYALGFFLLALASRLKSATSDADPSAPSV